MSSTTTTSPAPSADRRLEAITNHLAPARLVVVLPDGAKVSSFTAKRSGAEFAQLVLDGRPISEYTVNPDKTFALDITSVNTPFEGATTHVPKYDLVTLHAPAQPSVPSRVSVEDVWVTVYALFTTYHEQEYVPMAVSGGIQNAQEVVDYLVSSGLGRTYPSSAKNPRPVSVRGTHARDSDSFLVYLTRAAFWQGAGTTGYHTRQYWLQDLQPVFPSVTSFTRTDKVIAKHPLRPAKPRPGQVLYRRWCSAVGQMLEITAFDLEGVSDAPGQTIDGVSRHLAAFHKWHNDPRVNNAWKEKGTLEQHRAYIENSYADAHAFPAMFSWDGELTGYLEINYAREDHVAQHFPMEMQVGDWDRGIHVLNGEAKFLGGGRSDIWMRSLIHYLYLADPRTWRIIGEPDHSNPNIIRVADNAEYNKPIVFDFPYKRSVIVYHTREKFFVQCKLR